MARMYPELLSASVQRDPLRRAERDIYAALRDQLGHEWLIFYSVAWLTPFRSDGALHDGEADFLAVHPELGVLSIEAKGGAIAYDGAAGAWTQVHSDGETRSIHPVEQARKSKYYLKEKIASLPGWSQDDIARITFAHAVFFPDVHLSDADRSHLPPDVDRVIVLDGGDMSRLPQRLTEIFSRFRGERSPAPRSLGLQLDAALIETLAPKLRFPNPLGVQAQQINSALVTPTEEQNRILITLQFLRRVAISGPAGSGKTFVAMEKARRLAREGFQTRLLCRSNLLGEYLGRCLKGSERIAAGSFMSWCQETVAAAGVPPPSMQDKWPDALLAALALKPSLVPEALIIDEAQDFEEEWWAALQIVLPSEAILYVFFDDNQRVRRGGAIPADLAVAPFPLTENVRNARPIWDTLSNYYQGAATVTPRGPSGPPVAVYPYADESEMARLLEKTLRRLIVTERIRAEEIVLLTPRSTDESALPPLLERFDSPLRGFGFHTIADFKGLEASVILVAELDSSFAASPQRDALAYVAFSRARAHLLIFGDAATLNALSLKP